MQYLWYYLLAINALCFLLMQGDKRRAQEKKWRIPEAVLLFFPLLGGSLGAVMGMLLCRHKTKHPVFAIGLPVMLFVQIGILLLCAGIYI